MPDAPVEAAIVSLLVDTGGYYSNINWSDLSFLAGIFIYCSFFFVLKYSMFKSNTKNIHTSSPSLDKDLVCDVPDL